MKDISTTGVQMQSQTKTTSIATRNLDLGVSTDIEANKEEKAYQKLINEKLKSAGDWYIRDSKSFSIR